MSVWSKSLCCAALVLVSALAGMAQNQTKDAPVPIQILTAKKVFISNSGADAGVVSTFKQMGQSRSPYDRFYSEMKAWGRYELVSSPADADLVFEIKFSAPISSCDSKLTGYAPQYTVSILDVKTGFTLWTLAAPVEGAFRKATFEKNLTAGMTGLMSDLKQLAVQATSDLAAANP